MSEPSGTRAVTVDDMLQYAKRLRIKVYYDVGGPDESERESTERAARCAALLTMAESLDETFGFTSELTQADLGK